MRKITNNKYNYEVNSDKTSGYSTINDHVLDEILNYDGENKIDNILNGEIEIGENDLFPPIVKIIKLTLDYKEIELNTARAKLFTQNEFSNKNIIYKTVEETNIELLLNRDLFYKSNEESYEPDGNKFLVTKNDPRFLSGELVGVSKGKIWINNGIINKCIDKNLIIPDGWIKGVFKKKKET